MWHFRGAPHFIDRQATRLGVTRILADRAKHNPEIVHASRILGELCSHFHRVRKEDGRPAFLPQEFLQVKATLHQCEQDVHRLFVLAAASAEMMDEAWRAHGIEPPNRQFSVACDFDSTGLPSELSSSRARPPKVDGHPGLAEASTGQLIERVKRSNRSTSGVK